MKDDESADGSCPDIYICRCKCHEGQLLGIPASHVTPCCVKAPCGLNITTGLMELHMKQCDVCDWINTHGPKAENTV